MVTFMDLEENSKEEEKCLNSELWYACAGVMVQMPAEGSKVFYFPQGHAEHACGPVDLRTCSSRPLPSSVLCTVTSLKYMVDPDTDEVFAKLSLVPLNGRQLVAFDDDAELGINIMGLGSTTQEKLDSFAKTLTQSDANNGGGFSVPRYCAEKMFPALDFSEDPPLQYITAKDVHGESWKFKHIYRGTPRRHLLTTGWSPFVNKKKLVAGDSVVFLKAKNKDLFVGIRRAKRGNGVRFQSSEDANCCLPYGGGGGGGLSAFLREDEIRKRKLVTNKIGVMNSSGSVMGSSKVVAEAVIEAANLAANGRPFEVTYYPRASTPQFCVKASLVKEAIQIRWSSGMRFKMALETEDSSRISWFMGTISSVQAADPLLWPASPWRSLQVKWDEPDLLQNVKRVSPWLIELVTNMPAIPSPLSPSPNKKLRLLQHPHFPPFDAQFYLPAFSTNLLRPPNNPYAYHLPEITPAGIQGARQPYCAPSLQDPNPNLLHPGLLLTPGFPLLIDRPAIQTRLSNSNNPTVRNPSTSDNVSCQENSTHSLNDDVKTPHLVLFGKKISTVQNHISTSTSTSCDRVSPVISTPSSSSRTANKLTNFFNGERQESKPDLEMDHCKVFLETEDLGRTMDLSLLGSYDDLYKKLTEMFGIVISDQKMLNHVIYQDKKGVVKRVGDEPFSVFTKNARRLTILTDSSNDNVGGRRE